MVTAVGGRLDAGWGQPDCRLHTSVDQPMITCHLSQYLGAATMHSELTQLAVWSCTTHRNRDLGDDGVFTEGAAAHEMRDRLPLARETGRAIWHQPLALRTKWSHCTGV